MQKKPIPSPDSPGETTEKPEIKMLIEIIPDPTLKDHSKITFKITSDAEPQYSTVINALICLIDDLITKQQQSNVENALQLEKSQTI